jgi:SulP family sulfate permease
MGCNDVTTRHQRFELNFPPIPKLHFRLGAALRETLAEGYTLARFRGDLVAGLTVGLIALPLSMALAIATGVPPQYGLYTAIVAGALAALCGGSRVAVTGPTAAFVVILVPIVGKFGLGGLLIATFMAGVILVLMGVARLGRLIQFIPHPVTTGFTAGIATVIATLQIKDFLGLTLTHNAESYLDKVQVLVESGTSLHWPDAAVGGATLAMLIFWRRYLKRIPAPLGALTLAAVGAYVLHLLMPETFTVATIASRFTYTLNGATAPGIPQVPPTPMLPWTMLGNGPDGQPLQLSWGLIEQLLLPATAIAMLGAIESLLCAVVADGMAGTRHDPDVELIGQGIGNLVAPFFGGFAATGAIARTAANIRAGGHSPVAAIIHALFVLTAVLVLAPVLGYLPMASMAALLLIVAWNMSEIKHFLHTLRVAPRSDVVVLVTCFGLTVVFDMVVAVTVGVLLAALLFMRRMAELTQTRLTDGEQHRLLAPLPPNVLLYEVAGPLFFGAAEKAATALTTADQAPKAVIVHLGAVPAIDMTGLVALETALDELTATGALVVLTAVQPYPREALTKAGIVEEPGKVTFCQTMEEAEMLVRLIDDGGDPSKPALAAAARG